MKTVRRRWAKTAQISVMEVVRVARVRWATGGHFLTCACGRCSGVFLMVIAGALTWFVAIGTMSCALPPSGATASSTSVVASPNTGSPNTAPLWPMPATWESTWRGWKFVCVLLAGHWWHSDWSKPSVGCFMSLPGKGICFLKAWSKSDLGFTQFSTLFCLCRVRAPLQSLSLVRLELDRSAWTLGLRNCLIDSLIRFLHRGASRLTSVCLNGMRNRTTQVNMNTSPKIMFQHKCPCHGCSLKYYKDKSELISWGLGLEMFSMNL